MRLPHLIVLAWLLPPALALARPKVAIAPLDGDKHGDVADIVAEEAADHAKVVTPDRVGRVMDSLGLSTHNKRSLRTLCARLEVDAVIYGLVEHDGSKRRLELTIAVRGKPSSTFTLKFTSASSHVFRRQLREELARRIAAAEAADTDDPGDAGDGDHRDGGDEDRHGRDHHDAGGDNDRHARHGRDGDDGDRQARDGHDDENDHARNRDRAHGHDDREATRRGDHHRRVATGDDDDDTDTSIRRRRDEDDDGEGRHRRRHHHLREVPRHPVTQSALWLDVGPGGAHRSLTYGTAGQATPPPPVGTGAFAAQLDAEVYPAAFSTLHGAAAGFGLAASYGQSLGLAIQVPGTTVSAPIDEGHYSIGARYRFVFGQSSLALGLDYWSQHDVANRTPLMGTKLDMPDTKYVAVAPGAIARFPVAPKVGITLAAQVPLMLASGGITSGDGFGIASVFAFAGQGGVDIALAPHYGLRLAVSYDQVGLTFKNPVRGVSSATDAVLDAEASFAIIY